MFLLVEEMCAPSHRSTELFVDQNTRMYWFTIKPMYTDTPEQLHSIFSVCGNICKSNQCWNIADSTTAC